MIFFAKRCSSPRPYVHPIQEVVLAVFEEDSGRILLGTHRGPTKSYCASYSALACAQRFTVDSTLRKYRSRGGTRSGFERPEVAQLQEICRSAGKGCARRGAGFQPAIRDT